MRKRRVTHWKNLKKLPMDAARKTIESSPRRQKASLQSTKVLRREPSWAGEDSSSFVTELKDREAFFFRSAVGSKAKNLCRGSKMRLGDHVGLKTGEQGNMRRVLADQLTETVVAILARALGAARRTRRRGEGRRREAAALCALAREAGVGVHLVPWMWKFWRTFVRRSCQSETALTRGVLRELSLAIPGAGGAGSQAACCPSDTRYCVTCRDWSPNRGGLSYSTRSLGSAEKTRPD